MKNLTVFFVVACISLVCATASTVEEMLWCEEVQQLFTVEESCGGDPECCSTLSYAVGDQCMIDYEYYAIEACSDSGMLMPCIDSCLGTELYSYCWQFDPSYFEYCLIYYYHQIYQACLWECQYGKYYQYYLFCMQQLMSQQFQYCENERINAYNYCINN